MTVPRLLHVAVLGALVATASAVASPGATRLNGSVGPGFTISLTSAKGQKVKTLKPGRYTFVVTDRSASHSFVLEKSGGSFEKEITGVGFRGQKRLTVTLTKGKWEFYCEPHASSMHGDFRVA